MQAILETKDSKYKLLKNGRSMAFMSCADLTTVSIAKGSKLKSVGRDPFSRCEKLAPVTFPPGVEAEH